MAAQIPLSEDPNLLSPSASAHPGARPKSTPANNPTEMYRDGQGRLYTIVDGKLSYPDRSSPPEGATYALDYSGMIPPDTQQGYHRRYKATLTFAECMFLRRTVEHVVHKCGQLQPYNPFADMAGNVKWELFFHLAIERISLFFRHHPSEISAFVGRTVKVTGSDDDVQETPAGPDAATIHPELGEPAKSTKTASQVSSKPDTSSGTKTAPPNLPKPDASNAAEAKQRYRTHMDAASLEEFILNFSFGHSPGEFDFGTEDVRSWIWLPAMRTVQIHEKHPALVWLEERKARAARK